MGSGNWIVDSLNSALGTWNGRPSENEWDCGINQIVFILFLVPPPAFEHHVADWLLSLEPISRRPPTANFKLEFSIDTGAIYQPEKQAGALIFWYQPPYDDNKEVHMKYDRGFIEQQTVRNSMVNYILCAMLFAVECSMVLVWYASQYSGNPSLDKGYLYFYWIAIIGSALHPIFNYATKRYLYHRGRVLIQLSSLFILLAWACLFAAYDVHQGNSGSAFTQILILTSAAIWMPRWMHYSINVIFWTGYLVLIVSTGISSQFLYSEVINSGIFLLISCLIIYITDSFQYSVFRVSQERLRLQNEEMDMMAEQIRTVHNAMEETRIMRHDLRHYARAVEQKLEQSDYEGIRKITADITKGLEHAELKKPLYAYTKIPEIDAILSQYQEWAEREGIDFHAELPLPDMMEVRDIAMLLMNALENAANAVKEQPAGTKRYIGIMGARYASQYYLNISNSYNSGTATINSRTGLPTASKPGHGYGTKSIAAILGKYQAHFRFQAGEKEFCLQMLLPAEDIKAPAPGQRPSAGNPES